MSNVSEGNKFSIPTFEQYQEAKNSLAMCESWLRTVKKNIDEAVENLCTLHNEEVKYKGFIDKLKEMVLIYETAHKGENYDDIN